MSESKLLDYLNANYEAYEKYTNDQQRVFALPGVMFGFITFFSATGQINIHAREYVSSKAAVSSFLLDAVPFLTLDECSKDIPLSYSWEKTIGKPEKDLPGSRALLLDDIIEIGISRQHLNSLALPHVGISQPTGKTVAERKETITRAVIANLVNAYADDELNNYFMVGQTSSYRSPDLPPPAQLSFSLHEGQRGNGLAVILYDIVDQYQAIVGDGSSNGKVAAIAEEVGALRQNIEEIFARYGSRINTPTADGVDGQKPRLRIRLSQAIAALRGQVPPGRQ